MAAVQRDTQRKPSVNVQQSSATQPHGSLQKESSDRATQSWSLDALRQAQRSDTDINTVIKFLEDGDERPSLEVVEPLSSVIVSFGHD